PAEEHPLPPVDSPTALSSGCMADSDPEEDSGEEHVDYPADGGDDDDDDTDDEVEKYVSGLPDMIRGNVMSYRPQTMEEVIEFSNDQMNQKFITISERKAKQKRKIEFNVGNNQGYQQQNKRQNIRRAYTVGTGEKREYPGSLPLCTKCNYHHKGPCAPRCNKCKRIGHLARDCRSSGPNHNNNNCGNSEATQNAVTCYEYGVQGHFKRDCPKLKN
ncbi:reverse transcriptase domain-containing protein, partial [Tanacetum coccineum]